VHLMSRRKRPYHRGIRADGAGQPPRPALAAAALARDGISLDGAQSLDLVRHNPVVDNCLSSLLGFVFFVGRLSG
jgi:hypothetical protein